MKAYILFACIKKFCYLQLGKPDGAVIGVHAVLRRARQAETEFVLRGAARRERTARKINNQKAELDACENKEQLRVFAELINANQYALGKGVSFYDLENYYENNALVRIPVSPALSPAQNAQKYYKAYKKAHTAEKMLQQLIDKGEQEIVYFDSVLDALSRAESENELAQIRQELIDGGYLKRKKGERAWEALPKARSLLSLARGNLSKWLEYPPTGADFLHHGAKSAILIHHTRKLQAPLGNMGIISVKRRVHMKHGNRRLRHF